MPSSNTWCKTAVGLARAEVFALLSISDSNANPLAGSALVGVGGAGFFSKRPLDRAGIGYFHCFFSDAITHGLEHAINLKLGNEQGMEAFYNFALTRWFRIATDLQLVQPRNLNYGTEV